MNGSTILIVDDERNLARAMKAFLAEHGYESEVAGDAEQALQLLPTMHPDVVFSDVRLPGMNGIELLKRIKEFDPAIPVVIMTAYGSIEGAVAAVKLGAFDYVKKPLDLEELKLLADRARETSLMKQELSYLRQRVARDVPFANVLGESPVMRGGAGAGSPDRGPERDAAGPDHRRNRHRQRARGPDHSCVGSPCESSVYRRQLHRPPGDTHGSRACSATSAGAFTDAKESKIGLFEAAEGGFLFLDEIGDVELALQGKLLRAIEERVVRRVGGIRDRKIDVRILAATNRDLERDVGGDRFRKDLYFRLAVILIRLPAAPGAGR